MHKCVNNTVGNVYQMVDNFFPYSQKQLGFDKGATIVFQSDQDNAGRMLGKTAYYDPENLQIVLYTDGRHPKDILRSLSHELVHMKDMPRKIRTLEKWSERHTKKEI
jgi:hypothetical protein